MPAAPSFREGFWFWLKLGFISFGGPAGQIAIMHAELVERRRWISERRFLHALNYCMLLPGPEAQQLATYLGWLLHRRWGGVVAGVLFVLPSLVLLVLLSWAYLRLGHVPWVDAVFDGLKPAVVALVLHAAWRMGRKTLHHPWLWGLAGAALLAIGALDAPFPLVVGGAALVGWWAAWQRHPAFVGAAGAHSNAATAGKTSGATHQTSPSVTTIARAVIDDDTPAPPHARPSRRGLLTVLGSGLALWLVPVAALLAWQGASGGYLQMAWFFTKAALMTFGGAYAVLPYVHQAAVEHHQWLTAAQMMDGLALGETTPGPLIMVVTFVGFLGAWQQALLGPDQLLLAGVIGACVVTWFTFLPSFVFILAGGPLVESSRGQAAFTAPLTAISAAIVGVIVHLAWTFAQHVFWPHGWAAGIDTFAVALAVLAAAALFSGRVGILTVLGGAAGLSLVVRLGLGS